MLKTNFQKGNTMDEKSLNQAANLRLSSVFHNGGSKNRTLPNIEDPDIETEKPPKDTLEKLGDLRIWPPTLL